VPRQVHAQRLNTPRTQRADHPLAKRILSVIRDKPEKDEALELGRRHQVRRLIVNLDRQS
jgi:hypothetical protein